MKPKQAPTIPGMVVVLRCYFFSISISRSLYWLILDRYAKNLLALILLIFPSLWVLHTCYSVVRLSVFVFSTTGHSNILTWPYLGRLAFVPDEVSKSMTDSRLKGLRLRLGHLWVGVLQHWLLCSHCIGLDLAVQFKLFVPGPRFGSKTS